MPTEVIEPKSHAVGLLLGIGALIVVVVVVTLVLIKCLGKGKEKK